MNSIVAMSIRRTKIFYGTAWIIRVLAKRRDVFVWNLRRGWARRGRRPVVSQTSAHSISAESITFGAGSYVCNVFSMHPVLLPREIVLAERAGSIYAPRISISCTALRRIREHRNLGRAFPRAAGTHSAIADLQARSALRARRKRSDTLPGLR